MEESFMVSFYYHYYSFLARHHHRNFHQNIQNDHHDQNQTSHPQPNSIQSPSIFLYFKKTHTMYLFGAI